MEQIKEIDVSRRAQLAGLVDRGSPSDAMAAYYALEHPAEKVQLFAYQPDTEAPTGFVALVQTGLDLFRPLALPYVNDKEGLRALLRAALRPGRPVLLYLPIEQQAWAEGVVELSEAMVMDLLRLDPQAYEPVLNVLVVEARTPGGLPRYEVRAQDHVYAAAGLNWSGERFAEIYLRVEAQARTRGFGRSVLAAIAGRLLGERRTALYRVREGDHVAQTEAFRLGFRPVGYRCVAAQALLRVQEA